METEGEKYNHKKCKCGHSRINHKCYKDVGHIGYCNKCDCKEFDEWEIRLKERQEKYK